MLSHMNIEQKKKTLTVAKLFNEIANGYDTINSLLSFGLDKRWRTKCLRFIPKEKTYKILDIACGSCEQILAIGKKRPLCDFTGVDISEKLLKIGQEKLKKSSIKSHNLINTSALALPIKNNKFCAVTISFGIRNMENVNQALKESYRVLKKNGKIFILEFSLPEGFLQKKLSLFYLKHIVPRIGNLLSKHSHAYTYLNETIVNFPYGNKFIKYMEDAGFNNNKFYPMTFGMVTLYVGEKNE